jgi:hypothetical protein
MSRSPVFMSYFQHIRIGTIVAIGAVICSPFSIAQARVSTNVSAPEIIITPDSASTVTDSTSTSVSTTTGSVVVTPQTTTTTTSVVPEPAPTTIITPVSPEPSTLATEPASTTPKAAPRNGDQINNQVEDILNQIIIPQPIHKSVSDTDTSLAASTTSKLAPKDRPTPEATTSTVTPKENNDKLTAEDASTTATTTPIGGTINRNTDGDSNYFLPGNYYAPLDKLSPEATYGLSAIAALLGIVGVVLIIRDPHSVLDEEETWIPVGEPRFQPQEPLLEP